MELQTTEDELALESILRRAGFTERARDLLQMAHAEREELIRALWAACDPSVAEQRLLRRLRVSSRPAAPAPAPSPPRRAGPLDRAREIRGKFDRELDALLREESAYLQAERRRAEEQQRASESLLWELMRMLEEALRTIRRRWELRPVQPASPEGPDHTETARQLRLHVAELMDTVDAAASAAEDRERQLQARAVAALRAMDSEACAAAMPLLRAIGVEVVTDAASSPDLFDPIPSGQCGTPAYLGTGRSLIERGRAPLTAPAAPVSGPPTVAPPASSADPR